MRDLQAWQGLDSLVVAVYGAWGSGKSSVKNLLLEENKRKTKLSLPFVEFNPWQLSGTGAIPKAFFAELELALSKTGPKTDVAKRAKTLNRYAKTLQVAGSTAENIGILLAPFIPILGTIAASLGKAVKSAGNIAKDGSVALEAQHETTAISLEAQKQELSDLLIQMPKPMLIVIDDIDRLSTEEILQVFQVVKANANFPRLIYLLLFDREIVSNALNQISGGHGCDYLEKIVQVGYHIPHASHAEVQKILFRSLDKVLGSLNANLRWDKDRWQKLYAEGISGYFKNLRHVYRFMASCAFHFNHHRGKFSIEVNPVDLIGLESLRVFEPSVYESLPSLKTMLTRYEGRNFYNDIDQTTIDLVLSQLLARAVPGNQDKVKAILELLFPPILPIYDSSHSVIKDHHKWQRDVRICHPSLFDKYFTLAIFADDISQAELDNLIKSTSTKDDFITACQALKSRKLLTLAFERLDAYKEEIPIDNMPALIHALCDLADEFPIRHAGFFDVDLLTIAGRLVHFGLMRIHDPESRATILHDAFQRSVGLALPISVVSDNERINGRVERGHQFLVDEVSVPSLRALCVEKLRNAATQPELIDNPRLKGFLYRWSEWSNLVEVRDWIATQTITPKGFIWFLGVMLGRLDSWGVPHRVKYYIQLSEIEQFATVDHVEASVAAADRSELSETQLIALNAFLNALTRRSAGKPDDSWKDDDADPWHVSEA